MTVHTRKRAAWQEMLDALIRNRAERERIAAQVNVTAVTLTRWASGSSAPRPQNLRALLQAIPAQQRAAFQTSLEEELPSLALQEPAPQPSRPEIPFSFVRTVLATRASGSQLHTSWVLIHQILRHALLHLDPQHLGMKITLVQCMPPRSQGKIYSLRESTQLGTSPWREHIEEHALFLGAETLVGYTVTTAQAHQVPDLRVEPTFLPYYRAEYEVSAAAYPIMWQSHIAGCLLFSSTQVGAFVSPEVQVLLEGYTNLMALVFQEKDFYPLEDIQLHVMPAPERQQPYLDSFRQLVVTLMKEAAAEGHLLTSLQAEELAWQQIEGLLLDLPLHSP